jgi:hypothetical protein
VHARHAQRQPLQRQDADVHHMGQQRVLASGCEHPSRMDRAEIHQRYAKKRIPAPAFLTSADPGSLRVHQKSAIEGQKSYQSELVHNMRIYIHEHQTVFIPAGLDLADVANTVQEPSLPSASPTLADYTVGEGDDAVHRAHEKERDQRGLQCAYHTLEGTLSVA